MQKIGVFVCHCGTNIAATVDVEKVAQTLGKEPGVVFATDYPYMCSQTGQQMIQDKIHELGLTGVVICSCSPRMHEQTFRKACHKAGLNDYMVEIANIREQCSWIHKDKQEATEKAIILGRAAIAKVQLNAPLTAGTSPVTKRALVIARNTAADGDDLIRRDIDCPRPVIAVDIEVGNDGKERLRILKLFLRKRRYLGRGGSVDKQVIWKHIGSPPFHSEFRVHYIGNAKISQYKSGDFCFL